MISCRLSNEKKIMLGMLLSVGLMALYVCLVPMPAAAFGGGAVGAVETAAGEAAGISVLVNAADDEDD